MLAVSLAEGSARRGLSRRGRMQRDRWIDDLLSGLPAAVPECRPVATARGPDAVVRRRRRRLDRDVADLAVPDAVEVLVWMARTLVTAVLTEL